MLGFFIALVKFLGVVLTGAFGVLGLMTEYRDKEGTITRWGRIALIGTLTSTFVALAAQGLELLKQAKDEQQTSAKALEQARENSKVLAQIGRAVDPLDSMAVTAFLDVDLDIPELQGYRDRVLGLIRKAVDSNKKDGDGQFENGIMVSARSGDGPILSVSIRPQTPAYPDKEKEELAYYALSSLGIDFEFYKTRPPGPSIDHRVAPELAISFDSNEVELTYDLARRQFGIFVSSLQTDPKYWRNSGNILAVPDLPGRSLLVWQGSTNVPRLDDKAFTETLEKIKSTFSFRLMLVALPRGRELSFRNWPPVEHDAKGRPYIVLVFPDVNAGR
jgi:hypothetical protein